MRLIYLTTKRCIICRTDAPITHSTGHVRARMKRFMLDIGPGQQEQEVLIMAGFCADCESPDSSERGSFGDWHPDMGIDTEYDEEDDE